MKKSKQRIVVTPRSYNDLHSVSRQIRKVAKKTGYIEKSVFDVAGFYEYLAAKLPDTFKFHVAEAREFPDESHEGLTKSNGEIMIRRDVYEGALNGNGRDRFTMVHELLHWFIHREDLGLARSSNDVPSYKCPEWQANTGASLALMPTAAVVRSNADPKTLSTLCEVSYMAAEVRCNIYKNRGI